MEKVSVLILAAGFGTRMKSDIPKVLHEFDGIPIISRIALSVISAGFKDIVVVTGYMGRVVQERLKNDFQDIEFKFVEQKLIKGSGRAVYEAKEFLKNNYTLILSGDVPLIRPVTLRNILKMCIKENLDGVVVGCLVSDTKQYGRIIKDEKGFVSQIVEVTELKDKQRNINEINSGIYIFKTKPLLESVSKLKPKGPKKEYYLTDVVEYIYKSGGRIKSYNRVDEMEISGPNSKKELCDLEKRYFISNALNLINKGVIIKEVESVYISDTVKISKDTVVYPQSYISGKTVIGKNVRIGPFAVIHNSIIEDNSIIHPFSVISGSRIRKSTSVGPFTHIRPESDIGPGAKIGNFSEVKKSRIEEGSKVPHLSYIGDSEIGKAVNIGAGTITCNYDGIRKNKTLIKDGAFIGSNTNLVAPVTIGRNVVVGAGSTITDDVPDGKLAIARARQVVKERKK